MTSNRTSHRPHGPEEWTWETLHPICRWVHRAEHLAWRKHPDPLPERGYVAECWMPYTAPSWALDLAATGEPGSRWCPQIDPGLLAEVTGKDPTPASG
jgi:hypothetical protein